MQGVLILKLLSKKHCALERQSTSSAAEGPFRTHEADPLALSSLHLESPACHQCVTVGLAFAKTLTLGSSVRDLA